MLPIAVALSSGGVTHMEGAILGPIRKRLNRSRCRLLTWVGPRYMCYLGDLIPMGKGQFLGKCSGPLCSNRTLQCAVQNCWTDRHAVLDEDLGGPMEQCIRWACRFPSRRDNFRGFSGPFKSIDNLRCNVTVAFAAKGIMQSPITSCSRKDHLVC